MQHRCRLLHGEQFRDKNTLYNDISNQQDATKFVLLIILRESLNKRINKTNFAASCWLLISLC